LRSASAWVIVSLMPAALTWVLLAASLVVGLAALVRMAGPAAGPDDLTGVIRLSELVTGTIVALFALAAVVLLMDLVRRLRFRRRGEGEAMLAPEVARLPPWLRTLTQILSLLNFLVLAYLIWRSGIPLAGLLALGGGAGPSGALAQAPVGAPPLVIWTFGALALVAGLGALALALWVAFGDRLAEWWEGADSEVPPSPLAEAVDESLEDLRAEPDARRAIIRCYARFERVAAHSGVERKPWHTPMEFMREALQRLPVPRGAVPTLTGLFELARFSHRALGAGERDRALDALDEIKVAIEEGGADAVAG
jgi:hypothetical protein